MQGKFTDGLAFLAKLDEAVTGAGQTIERARLEQLHALMHITRANQLEKKLTNSDVVSKHAKESLRIVSEVMEGDRLSYHKAKALSIVAKGQLSAGQT